MRASAFAAANAAAHRAARRATRGACGATKRCTGIGARRAAVRARASSIDDVPPEDVALIVELLDSENGEELKEKVRAGESEEGWGGWMDGRRYRQRERRLTTTRVTHARTHE